MNNLEGLTVATFNNKDEAEQAFNEALKLGYKPEEINVLMSDESRKKYYDSEMDTEDHELTKGLTSGGLLGGAIGSVLGGLIALGTSFSIPGLGLIIAGPLAGAGGVSGVLLGSFLGWTSEAEPNDSYENALKSGFILLAVHETPGKPSLKEAWNQLKTPPI